MFLCRRQFPEVRTAELLAKLIDVVSSSGGSNRNTTNVATAAGSSSRAAVASSSVPVYEPTVQLVTSPSFAVDLNDGMRSSTTATGYPCPLTSADKRLLILDVIPILLRGRLCRWRNMQGCRSHPCDRL
ncbi:hypothetical protein Ahy_A07g033152 [Arachis hypogaea]|uniref:Uncharacterized protein n=1 Tax=Arachis hypogaea TaxID=3818 RepID=A0A445C8D7_ARAHY|nr:hypothetical protein Ahy_A07g033152 [Arachis hypogaea]